MNVQSYFQYYVNRPLPLPLSPTKQQKHSKKKIKNKTKKKHYIQKAKLNECEENKFLKMQPKSKQKKSEIYKPEIMCVACTIKKKELTRKLRS